MDGVIRAAARGATTDFGDSVHKMIDFLFARMDAHGEEAAVITPHAACTHRELVARVRAWQHDAMALPAGSVVSIEGDYGPELIAAFLALASSGHIVVPLSPDSRAQHASFLEIAAVEYRVRLDGARTAGQIEPTGRVADHPFYAELRTREHPGLMLFSSGSTGRPKAALHDLARLLAKYEKPRQRYRTLVFLLLDHIGGVNTLFYTLSNGGTVVRLEEPVAGRRVRCDRTARRRAAARLRRRS